MSESGRHERDRVFGTDTFKIPFVTFMIAFAVMASGITSASALAKAFAGDYAPGGKRLAIERIDHKREKRAIFTVRLGGSGLQRITPRRMDAASPDWSPNDGWIAFRSQEQSETRGNILLAHPDGSAMHRITPQRR